MANVTGALNSALKSRDAPLIGPANYSLDRINGFLREAYTINSRVVELLTYLRSIRQPYLSTASPPRRRLEASFHHHDGQPTYMNDAERDQIDADAKTVLRDIHAAVNVLAEAEKVRQQGEAAIAEKRRRKNDLGALGKWAAGGLFGESDVQPSAADVQGNGIKAHREGVIWYLQTRLDQCGRMQSSMMRIRLDREVEKSKSVLYKARGSGPVPVWNDDMLGGAQSGAVGMLGKRSKHGGMSVQDMEQRSTGQEQPSEEQMQLFAKENQDLLKQYENKMDQVRTAEKSILEIAELRSTIAQHLDTQSVMIDQLVQDSYSTTEDVGKGNKELKRASERISWAPYVFYATAAGCSFFIFWDSIV